MYVGQEYCRTDSTLRMVYDKVAFCLLTYLMYNYMDDLSIALSACYRAIMNHFMYADDLVIVSPSNVGLRALIHVGENMVLAMIYDLIIRKVL